MSNQLTPEDKDKLAYDWAEFKKMYGGTANTEQQLRDYILFMAGWVAHLNGGVV